MPGSATVPNVLAAIAGPANANLSLLDANWTALLNYINPRELTQDTFANRPAAGVAGRWYFATDTGVLYADTGTAWVQVALGTLAANLAETLTGLGLTNNAGDATNDIDIAAGAASSEDAVIANRNLMSLTTAITKQLDVAWAVGTNQGGRMSAGAIANTTYFIHLIKRLDTGVVDVGFDVSATAPTLPTNYTRSRRIGAIVRSAGAILAFFQNGDEFYWNTPPALDVNTLNPGAAAVTATLTVPVGIRVKAFLNIACENATTGNLAIYLSSLDNADVAPSQTVSPLGQLAPVVVGSFAGGPAEVWTNTAAQIRYRLSASGAADRFKLATLGWLDRRGRG